ncbi:MAG TPA: hypothetical protein VMU30_10405 [Bacteroidota bacterium]|nr:hypothetical protein [Bacteroidota bacterium]
MLQYFVNERLMYGGVKTFLDEKKDIIATVPVLAVDVNKFNGLLADLETRSEVYELGTSPTTKTKKNAKIAFAQGLFPLASALASYGHKNNNVTLQDFGKLTERKLICMNDKVLETLGGTVIGEAAKVLTDLAPYNITAESFAAIQKLLTDYSASLGKSTNAPGEHKGAGVSIEEEIGAINDLLENHIDHEMALLKATNPDTYTAYFDIRRVKNLGVRHEKKDDTEAAAAASTTTVK